MTKKRKGSGEETASNSGTPKKIKSESQFTAVGETTKPTNQQNKKNNNYKNSNNKKNTQNKTKSPNKQNSTNNTPNKNKKKNNNNKTRSDPETKALTTALFSELTSEDTDVPFANPFLLPKEHEETGLNSF